MKIINLGRGQGKTTRLLYASEFNDIPILCETNVQKQHLIDMANNLGLKIPKPIAISDLTDKTMKVDDVLVDEAHWVLQSLLRRMGMKGEVKAITLTEKE